MIPAKKTKVLLSTHMICHRIQSINYNSISLSGFLLSQSGARYIFSTRFQDKVVTRSVSDSNKPMLDVNQQSPQEKIISIKEEAIFLFELTLLMLCYHGYSTEHAMTVQVIILTIQTSCSVHVPIHFDGGLFIDLPNW